MFERLASFCSSPIIFSGDLAARMEKHRMQIHYSNHFYWFLSFLLLFKAASSQTIVKTLPGYPGELPFKLETGYISVGEDDEIQLFYYFIESEDNPRVDPLVVWHSGGPGCSGFSGLIYEIGPVGFDIEGFDGSLPSLLLNQYSWSKLANFIFIDSPAGTGFTYANTSRGYKSSDSENAKINYTFLRKWLLSHPSFIKNPLYVAGDSYGGKIAVLLAYEIVKGLDAGLEPRMSLQGYMIGNSRNEERVDCNGRVPYAHRMALVGDEHFERASKSCSGEYFHPDANNVECLSAIRVIQKCISPINIAHILEPNCQFASPRPPPRGPHKLGVNPNCQPFLQVEDFHPGMLLMPTSKKLWCRNQNYMTSYVWANDPAVREALGIRNGTVSYWRRCHRSLSEAHDEDVISLNRIHRLLSNKGYQALVYSGDHDLTMPFMSTLQWIRSLNLTLDEEWRPWNVNGQVAGYTETYKNDEAMLTFATIKGAGHTAPEYKPEESFAMMERWFSSFPL